MAGGDTYVVDIETIGVSWDSLDESTRDVLMRRAESDAEREAVRGRLGLDPGTGEVLVIGMCNVTNGRRAGVLVRGASREWSEHGPQGAMRFDGDERSILEEFWRVVHGARRIVTYNGRGFDGPFLMLRSAMLGVAPSVNLAGYRYAVTPHCDLADILTFHGATRRMFPLDYWCRRFDISSPKEQDLEGSRVQEYYEAGRLEEIVEYCMRDVAATAQLYEAVEETILPLFERGRS